MLAVWVDAARVPQHQVGTRHMIVAATRVTAALAAPTAHCAALCPSRVLVRPACSIPGDENFDRQCVGWTWYLSNDMQLFLTVPVFALLYAWRPAAGWAAVVAGTIASLAGAAATTYKDDLVSAILTPTDIATPGDYQASELPAMSCSAACSRFTSHTRACLMIDRLHIAEPVLQQELDARACLLCGRGAVVCAAAA